MNKKILIIVLGLLLIIGSGSAYFMTHFNLTGGCNDENVAEYQSPDQTSKATLFIRNCGATTDFSTQVSINGESVLVIKGDQRTNIKMNWKSDKLIDINYNGSIEKVFSSSNEYKDIEINFVVSTSTGQNR